VKPKRKHVRTGKKRGGAAPRDDDGFTPRQLVDCRRAELLRLEIAEKNRDLVLRSAVLADRRADAEVVQSDLYGALPARIATEIAGRKLNAAEVKAAVLRVVDELVAGWISGEILDEGVKHRP